MNNMEERHETGAAFQVVQEDKPFGCSECHKRFTRKGDMYRHQRTHTGEKPFSCPECADEFSRKDDMIRHLRTHTGVKPFQCTICNRKFSRRADLFKHMLTHDKGCHDLVPAQNHVPNLENSKRSTRSHKCSICSKTFGLKRDLTRHLNIHSVFQVSNLSSSDTVITNKENESHHENIQVQVTNNNNNDHDTQESCDDIFQLTVAEVPALADCKFLLITDDTVGTSASEAIQLIINDPAVQNVLLGNTTKNNNTKNSEKPFHCPQCGDKFGRKSDMIRHQQIHSGLKPYTCHLCGRPFSRKGDMNRHVLTHSGVKPYTCSLCCKSFARKIDFEVHNSVHSMEINPGSCLDTNQ